MDGGGDKPSLFDRIRRKSTIVDTTVSKAPLKANTQASAPTSPTTPSSTTSQNGEGFPWSRVLPRARRNSSYEPGEEELALRHSTTIATTSGASDNTTIGHRRRSSSISSIDKEDDDWAKQLWTMAHI